jgi:hypothetical protein
MTLEFDPNNAKDPKTPVWATYVPSRRPNFKTHTNSGHAKNAINYAGRGILYQHIDGVWVEVDRHEPATHCAHCEQRLETGGWRRGGYDLHRHPATPAYKKPKVCETCYYQHFRTDSPEPIPHEWCGQVSPIA